MSVFANPEVKKHTLILAIILLLFSSVTIAGLWSISDELKQNYVELSGSLVGTVLHQHPELEKEIVPLLTQGSNEQYMDEGLNILNAYGYNRQISPLLIPQLQEVYPRYILYSACCLLLLIGSLLGINYRYNQVLFGKIRRVTQYADQVIEGNLNLQMTETKEGDFSKLSHSLNRMRLIIQRHIHDLTKEKQFLVRLMSDISHQLKTPLASLMMYTEILAERPLTKEQQRMFLQNSEEQLERMNWLIQSLLKLAKLDVGAIQFQRTKGRLDQTVQASTELLHGMAEKHKVDVQVITKTESIMLHDREWLIEALLNLIKNAIEHTPEGGHVFVELERGSAVYKIHIRDEGGGIERADLPHIFERFYRGKNSKKTGSVGIGLSLSKSIVEGHYGYIDVQSERGKGTTFTIVFPVM
ncbi:HAMP domain-containing histidine kinase [Paenibacillus albiflavus]|uniref:histidine kinase n=1 Tax=Paenibacillus albiflavus TaxID=2545760 RepID=A0A4R4EG42_9BACL|nr:HAMP domain-containing sensor histidine kinase [Paenibacillus albiflavus]TCZ78749.1 HAMP domain-containing histidine kinase [Paenibacillus albiflavus]